MPQKVLEKLNAPFVAPQAPDPSPACCEAAEKFNAEKCSCNPAMLDVVSGFTGRTAHYLKDWFYSS
jgi:hypothetical protein